MRHYPVFLDLRDRSIVVSGAGPVAVAKLRLLMKTEARIEVYGAAPLPEDPRLGRARVASSSSSAPIAAGDAAGAALVYGANGDAEADARAAAIGRAAGALVNIVDDLDGSDFITPAIVDRDPVTVAIGTEGAAPVLARKIKAEVEAMLPATARPAHPHRPGLPRPGRGPRLEGPPRLLDALLLRARPPRPRRRRGGGPRRARADARDEGEAPRRGFVHLVGAGPGDPELLTLKARRLLHEADVVVHDRLVPAAILELARREATIVEVGKQAYGPSWRQDDINALLVKHARDGASRRPAQGRRPGGLRPARRGDRGAGGRGHPLRRRPRHHRGERGGGGDRPVADQARPQLGLPHPDRPRRRRLRRARLAGAGAARPDRGDLHGRQGRDLRPRPAADARRRRRYRRHGGRECRAPRLPGDRDDADRPAGGARRCRAREGPVMILYGLAPRAAALMLDDLREAL